MALTKHLNEKRCLWKPVKFYSSNLRSLDVMNIDNMWQPFFQVTTTLVVRTTLEVWILIKRGVVIVYW